LQLDLLYISFSFNLAVHHLLIGFTQQDKNIATYFFHSQRSQERQSFLERADNFDVCEIVSQTIDCEVYIYCSAKSSKAIYFRFVQKVSPNMSPCLKLWSLKEVMLLSSNDEVLCRS